MSLAGLRPGRGSGSQTGADGGSHGEGGGERDRPTGAWLAESSSDLGKTLMCTDGAGWGRNQLGWRRACSARSWFGAGCVWGLGLAPSSGPLAPGGWQRQEGKVRCEKSPPNINFSYRQVIGSMPAWFSPALIIYLLQPPPSTLTALAHLQCMMPPFAQCDGPHELGQPCHFPTLCPPWSLCHHPHPVPTLELMP